ncbi:D-alanyl-D-alanine carboxypeptidase [Microbacterium sp. Mu-80]|uniref:D-alanyl-D-alanine carboxypeptidase n=1 Tax=Microbacterium bandirmense TaxID=3122050 RepID=A0ABU8L9V4_9MICO
MTTSPESTRPATRRELRERAHAQAETAFRGPLPAFGDSLRAADDGIIDDAPTPGDPGEARPPSDRLDEVVDDTDTAEHPLVTGFTDGYLDTVPVGVADSEPEPRFFSVPADGHPHSIDADADPDAEFDALLEEGTATREVAVVGTSSPAPEPQTEWADEKRPPTALTWIDTTALTPESLPESRTSPELFAGAKLVPGWLRPRVLIPIGIVAAVCGSYVATTLLWPLNAVAPVADTAKVEIAPAPVAAVTWPGTGSAAVTVEGIAPVASTTDRDEIASISKVASVLMVLDELPLEPGEQGPSFEFDYGDTVDYWQYRSMDQSALDVPVGGSLTEYQMLQGVLLGSANNYIDRLSDELWGSDWAFAQASEKWLSDHGIDGMVIESPSGFDEDNIASPTAVLELGELAMKNPVFAEIVGTRTAEIPGAGTVTNTNGMLEDAGVVGIKTGTLSHWNLLTAKDVPSGDGTVRLYAAVLGQDDDEARLAVTRQLFAEVEASLASQPIAVPKGTVVGHVSTEWGDPVDVVSDADAQVVLWNGATATAKTTLDLGDETEAGAQIGTLIAEGPLGTAETSVSLAGEITPPSAWWRLTHPLELLGID